jgi:hypothetical protein
MKQGCHGSNHPQDDYCHKHLSDIAYLNAAIAGVPLQSSKHKH